MSTSARFSDEERAKIRHYMDAVYDVFKGHVTAARKDKLSKPIDEIAGGRVFTGTQALELGLVDKIGGLDDAIAFAAKKANVSDYEVRVIPEPPTIFDMFMPAMEDQLHVGSGSFLDFAAGELQLSVLAKIDPLRTRILVQALRRIDLIHSETVIAMMPEDVWIRSR
jgi:protease IV